ncbi:uncharacterized protein K02A2.6 [Hydra vulgaris]|uniref:uncharacterized protein K02A2.6 n=1 Tax=Hydra vulgaris TaxID=6087 RepID=UPI001F5FBAB4|nr:uncharacterized protein K02A2.6-like [Hydra vulgaris]
MCDSYPLPRTEDLFATLAGGQKFTKLDLAFAYQQLLLDKSSCELLTVNTHRGLFEPIRLQFGVHSASGIFQREIEKLIGNLPFTKVRVDDILVSGRSDEEHLKNVETVLHILEKAGLKLKENKCVFMSPEVEYLGFKLTKDGVVPLEDKLNAIRNAPEPKDTTQVKSFLGMINYYHRHLPNLATIVEPLHRLLRKGILWLWGMKEQTAFDRAKAELCSPKLLMHYDPKKELILSCDASPYGIGAVLAHVTSEGSERPITYISRTLSAAERNYSQIEKEALSIVFAVKKLHQYLYGRYFTLVTDHKPLLGLLAEGKPIPAMTAARIQRWALTLSAYNYCLKYRSGATHGNADCMSRLPIKNTESSVAENVILMMELSSTPVSAKDVKIQSARDPIISRVLDGVLSGLQLPNETGFKPFIARKYELGVEGGILMWGNWVVIPASLQEVILKELHSAHPGVVRMKALARSYVWWPNMDKSIEETVRRCRLCELHQRSPESAPIHYWEYPSKPWSRIHLDYAGPFLGHMFLIVCDAYSKWIEAIVMKNVKSENLIEQLRSVFAIHGVREVIVSDNGTSFSSAAFAEFVKRNSIRHIFTAPYHPSSNGQAERMVQTFKEAMKKLTAQQGNSIETTVNRFLFSYRITPHSTTGISPAELLMKRKLRSAFQGLKPDLNNSVKEKQERAEKLSNRKAHLRKFDCGDQLMAKNFGNGPKWIPGRIIKQKGPVNFEILTDDVVIHRHIDQIRLRFSDLPEYDSNPVITFPEPTNPQPPVKNLSLNPFSLQPNTSIAKELPSTEESTASNAVQSSTERDEASKLPSEMESSFAPVETRKSGRLRQRPIRFRDDE